MLPMDLFSRLQESYLAAGLLDDEVRTLAAIAETCEFPAMHPIVRSGELATDFYVLLDGKVQVQGPDGEPISRLAAGSAFGEVAVLSAGERAATVLADGNVTVARFSAEKLNDLIDREPRIGVRLLRNVATTLHDRLRSANVQLERVLALVGF
jgi:CRP-like cAMP-binding protein